MTEPCAHCRRVGIVALEVFSYYKGEKTVWLCGPETGRDCARRYGR